ncbi:MAG: hypothetical protein JWQ43_1397 [Glaciihabitans sp.]|nr:hypothetical protein [Glaciihabitans sp.]
MAKSPRAPALIRWSPVVLGSGSLCIVLSVVVSRGRAADILFTTGIVIIAAFVIFVAVYAVQAMLRATRRRAETSAIPGVPLPPAGTTPQFQNVPAALADSLGERLARGVMQYLADRLQHASQLEGRQRSAALDVTERAYAGRKVLLRQATAKLATASAPTLHRLDNSFSSPPDLAECVLGYLPLPMVDFEDAVRFHPFLGGLKAADVMALFAGIRSALAIRPDEQLSALASPAEEVGAHNGIEDIVTVAVALLPVSLTPAVAALVLANSGRADLIADDIAETYAPLFEFNPDGSSADEFDADGVDAAYPSVPELTDRDVELLARRLGLRPADPTAVARFVASTRAPGKTENPSG